MPERIKEIVGLENKGTYALVHVITDTGLECQVYIGGKVETYFDEKHNKVKAFVKKTKT